MALEVYNAEEAQAALSNALSHNEELLNKFNETNQKVAAAFTNAGDAVQGKLGEAAANCWGDGSGDYFSRTLSQRTEEFLANRVPAIMANMSEFASSTEQAYNSTANTTGTGNVTQ